MSAAMSAHVSAHELDFLPVRLRRNPDPRRSLRMELWATLLGAEVAVSLVFLACYDWSILASPLP